jgi:hypothetical protein
LAVETQSFGKRKGKKHILHGIEEMKNYNGWHTGSQFFNSRNTYLWEKER